VITLNREQVIELFKFLKSVYPTFEVSSKKVDVWTKVMSNMDYDRVIKKAEGYVVENKYPPTIADLAAYAPPKNETLKKMERWEHEAEQVPDHVKKQFRDKLKQLIQEKSQ